MATAASPRPTTRLTEQQRAAIETRSVSVALSAGAGCGKTFVLTERFLSHLDPEGSERLEPAELSELVAITFTQAAAREMRERIRSKCLDRLRTADEAHADYWLQLLRSLDAARVSTIHSFCGNLLRSHSVEAGLDPAFAILEQAQSDTLLAGVISDTLRERLIERDETTLSLTAQLGLERLTELTATLLGRTQDADLAEWVGRTPEELVARWQQFHTEKFCPSLLAQVARSECVQNALRALADCDSSNATMQQRRDVLLELLPRLEASTDPLGDLAVVVEHSRVQGGGTAKHWSDPSAHECFKNAATALRDEAKGLLSALDFHRPTALRDAEMSLRLLQLAAQVRTAYDETKRQLSALDFGDLMVRARQLLVGPSGAALRRGFASRLRLLMVDEFQDTDPAQVELVKALCGDDFTAGKLFFVGDFKQSIYRFRGAQPHVFLELEQETPKQGQLQLTLNFRSQPAVLDFVNALFPTFTPLHAHRPQLTPQPAIEFLWAPQQGARNQSGATEKARREEAEWIARRLRQLLDDGEPRVVESPKGASPSLRPVRKGDIAILFRALSDVAYYEQALQQYDIDYYLVKGHAFYAQQEIFDVLNLLRAVASSADEVSLAGVLRSPFFSLSDETLFWLAQSGEGLSEGLFRTPLPESLEASQVKRARFAAETLAALRWQKDRVSVAELLNEALHRTGYDAALLAEFLGTRKLANLKKLVQQARDFDRAGLFSLADFIVQLSQFVAEQPREPLAATHPENTDVVRLMSVHQSKGLEFPVVVVPDLDRPSNARGAAIDFHPQLGPLAKAPEPPGTTSGFSGPAMLARLTAAEEEAELERLLYVATTRAADCLILSSGMFDLSKPAGPWGKLLAAQFDLATGQLHSPDDGKPRPTVRVIQQQPTTDAQKIGRKRAVDLHELVGQVRELARAHRGRSVQTAVRVEADGAARRQYSFSRLNGTLHLQRAENETMELDPEAALPTSIDPLGLGTLVHAVLADLHTGGDDCGSIIRRHADKHLVEQEEVLAEATTLVTQYAESECAARIAAAVERHVETEFLLSWPPLELIPGGIYLHGFLDCCYRDAAGAWHIVDFKTNQVTKRGVPGLARQYEMQMYVYALAAEQALRQPPASLTLHFLRTGLDHAIPWNDEARTKAIAMINEALLAAGVSTTPRSASPRATRRPTTTQRQLW